MSEELHAPLDLPPPHFLTGDWVDTIDCLDSVEKVKIFTPPWKSNPDFLVHASSALSPVHFLTGDWWIPKIVWILTLKANKMHYFSTLFGKALYMFGTGLLSIIRSLYTVFLAIGICHTSYVAVC
jgi:hypothetical protein